MDKLATMKLWESVCTTDPKFTKMVAQRGGFTAICAQYQLRTATEQWGPYGSKWGVSNLHYDYVGPEGGAIIEATLEAVFWYPGGEFPLSTDSSYRAGNDTRKKLLTDLTTKALSKLGFNSDVFEGKFDDNKYVSDLKKTAAEKTTAPAEKTTAPASPEPPDPPKDDGVVINLISAGKAKHIRIKASQDGKEQWLDAILAADYGTDSCKKLTDKHGDEILKLMKDAK